MSMSFKLQFKSVFFFLFDKQFKSVLKEKKVQNP